MQSVCIECGNERAGHPVKEDWVIEGIRRGKKMLGIAKNNALVVCPECADARKLRREKFEKRLVQNGAIGVVLFLFLVLVPIFFGGGRGIIDIIKTIITAALLALLIIFFALLSYSPAYDAGRMVGAGGMTSYSREVSPSGKNGSIASPAPVAQAKEGKEEAPAKQGKKPIAKQAAKKKSRR